MLFPCNDFPPSAKVMEVSEDFGLFIAKPKVAIFSYWFSAQGLL